MGAFHWPVGVRSADGERLETVDALVDTGSSYSVFPRNMLERLGIEKVHFLPFEYADGRIAHLDVGHAKLSINGSESYMRVIFGDDDTGSVIGSNALQEFLLLVDAAGERLIPRTGRR